MNRDEAQKLLQSVLSGDVDGAEKASALQAMEPFPELKQEFMAHQALQAQLRGLAGAELPRGFEARLQARLEADKAGRSGRMLEQLQQWLMPLALAGAAGAAVWMWSGVAHEPGLGVAMSAVGAHAGVAEVVVRVNADESGVEKLNAAMRRAGVATLARQGVEGRTVVYAVETNGKAVRQALEQLRQVAPVEVVGAVPGGDVPVMFKVVLMAR